MIGLLFKQMLSIAINDELRCLSIRLEGELLRHVTEFDIWFETEIGVSNRSNCYGIADIDDLRSAHAGKSSKALTFHKHINEICTHIGNVEIQLKELVVVTQGEGRAYVQGMLDSTLFFFC